MIYSNYKQGMVYAASRGRLDLLREYTAEALADPDLTIWQRIILVTAYLIARKEIRKGGASA